MSKILDMQKVEKCHFCDSTEELVGKHAFISTKPEYWQHLGVDRVVIIVVGWCEGCWMDLCFEFEKRVYHAFLGKLIDRQIEIMLDQSIEMKNTSS